MNITLLTNFYQEFPVEFIAFLNTSFPEFVSYTVRGELDFNRWDIAVRNNPKIKQAIKLYEKHNKPLNNYFKFEYITSKQKGNILLNTETDEEFWEFNKKE